MEILIDKLKSVEKDYENVTNCLITIYPTCTLWAKKIIIKTKNMIKFPELFKWPDKNK